MKDCYTSIELINGNDLCLQRRNIIHGSEVRRLDVAIRVDASIHMLCINEEINKHLGLPVVENKMFRLPNGKLHAYDIVAPVEIRFANRKSTTQAIILPTNTQPVLGRLALLDMDVVIDSSTHTLIVNPDHPYFAQMKLK